jgi:predicted DNA-binding transcriptional regulator YafY
MHVDLLDIRNAIRTEIKLHLDYQDATRIPTERTIRPIAMIYYAEAGVIAARRELR